MNRLVALFLCAPLLAACGTTSFSEVVLRPLAPAHGPVPLYLKGQDVPKAYYDVALVQVVGSGSESAPDDVAAAVAARAGQLGCDAVVRLEINQGMRRTQAAGVCVRFTP